MSVERRAGTRAAPGTPGRRLHVRVPTLALLATALSAGGAAGAETPPAGKALRYAPAAGQDSLTVHLLTFGPGDRVWEKFGHNALWFRDARRDTDRVYNWGVFDFEQEDFLSRLLTGRMRYRLARSSLRRTLQRYRAAGRSIRVQELRLTPAQERELLALARRNYRPENQTYLYDPFRDNCSTRVRDLLDRVLGGRLRRQTAFRTTSSSYRGHARRLLQRHFWPYMAVTLGLGEPADRPITAWEEMFLPLALEERIRGVTVAGARAGSASLVAAEDTIYRARRPPPPGSVPDFTFAFLLAGSVGGALLAVLGRLGSEGSRPASRGFLVLGTTWSLLIGLAGLGLAAGWALTDHWYMHGNENLLQAGPLSAAMAFLVPRAVGWKRGRGAAAWTAWVVAGLAVAGALLQLLPGLDQANGEVIALLLPVHTGLAVGMEGFRG